MAQVVYSNVSGNVGTEGTLFEGLKIWFARRVPQRQRFVQLVQANGGEVVPLEKNADIKLVDHARKEAPPGTYSYKFVDLSIRNGHLEKLEDHAVGLPAGTSRTIGSITQPAKGMRTAFTAEDDRCLFDWVTAQEQEGGKTAGNEIYKQLEQSNPRHPWQAWRDRWMKRFYDKARPGPVPRRASPTARPDQTVAIGTPKKQRNVLGENKEEATRFSSEDVRNLLENAEDILNILPENLTDAWAKWASEFPSHSAQQWRNFWQSTVLPIHMERKGQRAAKDNYEPDQVLSHPRINPKRPAIDGPVQILGSIEIPQPAKRRQRSPSYQPKSHNLPVMKLAGANKVNGNDSRDESLARDAGSGTADSQSLISVLVKHIAAEVDDLLSSPLKTMGSVNKRQRQASSQEPLEVPSTPERIPRELGTPFDTVSGVINVDSDDEIANDGLGMPASQSLSEPSHSAHKTQPTFKDPTQYLGLEVEPPEGGWEGRELMEEEFEKQLEIDETQARTLYTQATFASQTQVPDFSLPEPDGGWDGLMPSSPPGRLSAPSQTVEDAADEEPESDTEEDEADVTARLDEWIDSHIAGGMEAEDVALALRCTSMEADLAEEILPYLAKQKSIPRNVRGVWTEEDDEDLDASDGRRIRRLQEKHGQEGFDARWEFLRIYRGRA